MKIEHELVKGLVLGVGVFVANMFLGSWLAGIVGATYVLIPVVAVGYVLVRLVNADKAVG